MKDAQDDRENIQESETNLGVSFWKDACDKKIEQLLRLFYRYPFLKSKLH